MNQPLRPFSEASNPQQQPKPNTPAMAAMSCQTPDGRGFDDRLLHVARLPNHPASVITTDGLGRSRQGSRERLKPPRFPAEGQQGRLDFLLG
jgi:hypothetical protein